MRWAVLSILLVACAEPPVPPRAPPTKPVERVEPHIAWANLPGCTHAEADRTNAEFTRFEKLVREERMNQRSDPSAATDVLASAWKSPCFVHVARIFPAPKPKTLEQLDDLWAAGLHSMRAMIGGAYLKDGRRYLVVPPELPAPTIEDDARHSLAPLLCRREACGHVATYIANAERAFDAAESKAIAWHVENGWLMCDGIEPAKDTDMTPFEAWARCIDSVAPRSYRYTKDIKLAAPERGFMVLRGRRGHYAFSDETRVYDLATGSAWVAGSSAELFPRGPEGKDRRIEAFTGNVLAEWVRALVFVATTKEAVVPFRSQMQLVPMPENLAIATSTRDLGANIANQLTTSAHTRLKFAVIDDDMITHDGTFLYPSSWQPNEDLANDLLRDLEAGLERGCPTAKLPLRIGKSAQSGVNPLDADPRDLVQVGKELGQAMDWLRGHCTK